MTSYTIYNLFFLSIALIVTIVLAQNKKVLWTYIKVSFFMVLFGFPWDYFAISQGAWIHPQPPGYYLFDVPLNDMVLAFWWTLLTCSLLGITIYKPISRTKGKAETKDGCES